MAEERRITRLQTPADENGVREDMDPITSADAVIYRDDKTLKEKLDELDNAIVISNVKPTYPCIWVKPKFVEEDVIPL